MMGNIMRRIFAFALATTAIFGSTRIAVAASTTSHSASCWGNGNTADITECFVGSASKADVELNRLYQKISLVLDPANLRQLQEAERRWIAYRDANCKAERSLWEGGTGANPAYWACIDDETKHRLDYLQTTYRLRLQKLEN
jgi:uncharacterized protein YecT (DUF1311 family)